MNLYEYLNFNDQECGFGFVDAVFQDCNMYVLVCGAYNVKERCIGINFILFFSLCSII